MIKNVAMSIIINPTIPIHIDKVIIATRQGITPSSIAIPARAAVTPQDTASNLSNAFI